MTTLIQDLRYALRMFQCGRTGAGPCGTARLLLPARGAMSVDSLVALWYELSCQLSAVSKSRPYSAR